MLEDVAHSGQISPVQRLTVGVDELRDLVPGLGLVAHGVSSFVGSTLGGRIALASGSCPRACAEPHQHNMVIGEPQ